MASALSLPHQTTVQAGKWRIATVARGAAEPTKDYTWPTCDGSNPERIRYSVTSYRVLDSALYRKRIAK
jgi:hypothetical protein